MRRILGVAVAAVALFLALYALRPGPGSAPPAAERAAPDAVPGEPGNASVLAAPALAAPERGRPTSPAASAPQESALDPQPVVPLEKLLTWTEPRPSPSVDLGAGARPGAEADAGSGSGLRKRVYLKRRSEDLAPGSQPRALETTDVGVRVPVDDSVSLRGGVRIESREEGEERSREHTPTVGVEVRF